ncbi:MULTISPECIES: hypothetical protein [Metabacillus]|uniref:DUF4129 domain-containing protein n=2 Tax=Metabacillus TaxID=2675233 RepID=A0A179SL21_9BACI|nr:MULTISPECIES: hypothetical protein [Metabacillus]OAS82131.1 hypothetical protein A6K24_13820 [Metabacillus litoralis]QNF29796.1 hypothetical protein HUW50_21260 [Metabacillus sp. KUDC1714]
MPNKARAILEKWILGMSELILIFPLVLLLGIYFVPRPLLWIAHLPILFIFGYLFRVFVQDKKRMIYLVFTILISACSAILFYENLLSYLVVFICNCIIFYRSILYAEREIDKLFSFPKLWMFGFPIYFLAYFVYRFIDHLSPYLKIITWTGLLLVVITLFTSNSNSLTSSTLSKQKKPFVNGSIKRKNQAYILIFISIIAVITNFKLIQLFLYKATVAIISTILSILSIFEKNGPIESAPPPAESATPVLEGGEPSTIAVILDKIMQFTFYSLALIVSVALIIFAGKKLGYFLKKGLKWVLNFLNQIFHLGHREQEEGIQYFDEKESLINIKKWGHDKKNQTKELIFHLFNRKPKWEDLSDREKVRYVYRLLVENKVKQGFILKVSHTPYEIISEVNKNKNQNELKILLKSYGKARYGKQDLSLHELEEVSLLLKSIKKD